jgi:7-carboxy-7-deazaguanine synthase (Cx14CxxC type)
MYSVKEIYYTLQGEGYHTGRAAVLLRFAGCNLWSGREEDRDAAVCRFCDTDFVGTDGPGGGRYATPHDLAQAVRSIWEHGAPDDDDRFTVLTGGEPLLQLDDALVDALHAAGLEIGLETNGTLPVPEGVDWVCVSPKAGADFRQRSGDELKVVFPQEDLDPLSFRGLDFRHFYLQPMDGPRITRNTELAAEFCEAHPDWKLSLQTHKVFNLP